MGKLIYSILTHSVFIGNTPFGLQLSRIGLCHTSEQTNILLLANEIVVFFMANQNLFVFIPFLCLAFVIWSLKKQDVLHFNGYWIFNILIYCLSDIFVGCVMDMNVVSMAFCKKCTFEHKKTVEMKCEWSKHMAKDIEK